ncbi:MAG TPA: FAD-dependent monooxygenase, partial [Micromonosporaceae bacterium]|nr:FAD-dependent monooxygenase [Micromonosporaceae bacterium]
MTRSVGIIGGGIGGLAAAIALHRAGWTVRVFERSAGLDRAGTALGMWPAALRALDTLGLGAHVRATAALQRGGEFLRPDGSRIATIDVPATRGSDSSLVYLLSRPALLRLLAEALPKGVVAFGTEITDVAAMQQEYDVVLAADGIFSRT